MNRKKYIENIVLREYYSYALKTLSEQANKPRFKRRRILPLTSKQKKLTEPIAGVKAGFQIVAKGKNLKNNFLPQQIIRGIQSSSSYGDTSAYGKSLKRLFVFQRVLNKDKKQIYIVYITSITDIDSEVLAQIPNKIGDSSYITSLDDFQSINAAEASEITTVSKNIATSEVETYNIEQDDKSDTEDQDDKSDTDDTEDQDDKSDTEDELVDSSGIPQLKSPVYVSNPNMKMKDSEGFRFGDDAFTKDIPTGDYSGTKSTLLNFLKPLNKIPGLVITSTKRDRPNTNAQNISDHWKGNLSSYGVDMAMEDGSMNVENEKDRTTYKDTIGDKIFYSITKALGQAIPKTGERIQTTATYNNEAGEPEDFRYQMFWRTDAQHFNHIHIGLRNETTYKAEGIEQKGREALEKQKKSKEKLDTGEDALSDEDKNELDNITF